MYTAPEVLLDLEPPSLFNEGDVFLNEGIDSFTVRLGEVINGSDKLAYSPRGIAVCSDSGEASRIGNRYRGFFLRDRRVTSRYG